MAILPPADIKPGRLFRSLLVLPRPTESIEHRIAAAPSVALRVRALSSLEIATAYDNDAQEAALLASALTDGKGRAVVSGADLLLLTDREFCDLRTAVYASLCRISPSYRLCDVDAWDRVLREGADQNLSVAVAMGSCREAVGRRIVEAPEKYFGVPRGALLDGHWMAFRAAQHVYEARRPKG
jgi:hypothetical protein